MNRRRLLLHAGVLIAACWIGLPFSLGGQAAKSLPARLSDQEFWKIVTEFSEPDGNFRSDNLLSNESQLQNVIPDLLKKAKTGGVYMGVGPEQNFTYIVALKPAMVFIVDIRRGNLHLHLLYKALFELSADRPDFVSRLFARERPEGLSNKSTVQEIFEAYANAAKSDALYAETLKAVKNQLTGKQGFALSKDDLDGIEYVYDAFAKYGPDIQYTSTGRGGFGGGFGGGPRGGFGGRSPQVTYADLMRATDADGRLRSYLASEESFAFLKKLETNNLLVPLVGDFAGKQAIRSVGRYLKEKGATVSAFYLSNVEMYLKREEKWELFCANAAALPLDETSTFIRSLRSGSYGPGGLASELGLIQAETNNCK
jgi:hypothetical protein